MKSPITTHVLDTTRGAPAEDVTVVLERENYSSEWKELGRGTTNKEGRILDLLPENVELTEGSYRLRFLTEDYFSKRGQSSLYPFVDVTFTITEAGSHYHIPLLISPYGYTTYRGS